MTPESMEWERTPTGDQKIIVKRETNNGKRTVTLGIALAVVTAIAGVIANYVFADKSQVAVHIAEAQYRHKLQDALNGRFDQGLKDLNITIRRMEMRQEAIEARIVPERHRVPMPDEPE